MATTDMHGYELLQNKSLDDGLRYQTRVRAVCCCVLSAGAVAILCYIGVGGMSSPSVSGDPAVTMAWQHVQPAGAWQHVQPARAWPFLQPAEAFQSVQPSKVWRNLPSMRFRQSMQPAATVSEDVVTEVKKKAEKAVLSASVATKKTAVLSALEAGSDSAVRAALATALPALEASNPTSEPALSGMLKGKWSVKYSGQVAKGPVDSPTREIALVMYAAGFGPGAAALSLANRLPNNLVQVKTVSLEISQLPGESRASMELRLLDGQTEADVQLACELVAAGPTKLLETAKEVRINNGDPVTFPEQLRYTRDLYVTYLDSDLLIARDATGSPDILVRESQYESVAAEPVEVVNPEAPSTA